MQASPVVPQNDPGFNAPAPSFGYTLNAPEARSCDECRRNKSLIMGCDESRPCLPCVLSGVECRTTPDPVPFSDLGVNIQETYNPGEFDPSMIDPDLMDPVLLADIMKLDQLSASTTALAIAGNSFDVSLQLASMQDTSAFSGGSNALSEGGSMQAPSINNLAAVPTPQNHTSGNFKAESLMPFASQTRIHAGIDATHGYGGVPECSRAEQELKNAAEELGWPVSPAGDFGTDQTSTPFNAGNGDTAFGQNLDEDFGVSFVADKDESIPASFAPQTDAPLPVNNLPPLVVFNYADAGNFPADPAAEPGFLARIPDVPAVRSYPVDPRNGAPLGFDDDGLCGELRNEFNVSLGYQRCNKRPSKMCDYQGCSNWTCRDCHDSQNRHYGDTQLRLLNYTKGRLCQSCNGKVLSDSRNADLNRCLCASQQTKSWLCHLHRKKILIFVNNNAPKVRRDLIKFGSGRNFCVGCFINDADKNSRTWGCILCRRWVCELGNN